MKLTPFQFEAFQNFMMKEAGVVLENGREYLVETRLAPLFSERNHQNVDEFIVLLNDPREAQLKTLVLSALTTHETSFFRDNTPFETLRNHILPDVLKRRSAERRIRVWCGACSTGQEPYSIALTWLDHFAAYHSWDFRVIASDICEDVLRKASEGLFSTLEVQRGLSAQALSRHFVSEGDHFRIKPDVRRLVEFKRHNLCQRADIVSDVDIVFLRNALIYFDATFKKNILQEAHRVLADGGILFLGTAETADIRTGQWKREILGQAAVYRATSR